MATVTIEVDLPPRGDHHRLPPARRRPRLRGHLALADALPVRPLPPRGRRPQRSERGGASRAGSRPLGPAQLLGLPASLPPLPRLQPPPAPDPAVQAAGRQLHLPL